PGAARGWSGLSSRLPSSPLGVDPKGVDWQRVQAEGSYITAADCPGARRFPFVAGAVPDYAPCGPSYLPDPAGEDAGAAQDQPGFWRRLFGGGRQSAQPQQQEQPAPAQPPGP